MVAHLVEGHHLHEGHPDAVGEPAVHLPLDDHRVDAGTAVVDGDEPPHLHLSGSRVDVDDADVRAERVGEVGRAVDGGRVQVALDAVPADEPVDLVEALAAPIPIAVIAEMLGVVGADRAQLRRWSDAAIESTDSTSAEQAEQLGQLAGFLMGHVRSPHTDRVDLLGLLKTTPVSDRLLDEAEIMGFCLTLLVAGNETTRTLISGGAEALARHPEQRAALASDAALVPGAVEEMLRWVTPIQAFGRTAAIDTEIAGCEVPAGTFVVMLYASANRDESVFGATSDQFDVGRPVHPTHLAFGFGEHSCLGASLARLESRIFFEELLARYPRYRLHGEPSYTASTLVNGARFMPVLLSG